MQLNFKVQGSSDEPYDVVFHAVDGVMVASCTCRAGVFGQLCKHRVQLLSGDSKQVVSGNESEVIQLSELLQNSGLKSVLDDISQLEVIYQQLSKQLKSSKKQLAKLLNRDL